MGMDINFGKKTKEQHVSLSLEEKNEIGIIETNEIDFGIRFNGRLRRDTYSILKKSDEPGYEDCIECFQDFEGEALKVFANLVNDVRVKNIILMAIEKNYAMSIF